MHFPSSAVERAMKVRDVIVRAMNGEYTWLQAAEILGMSPRSVRRLRYRMERHGYAGLIDMRRGVPSPRRAPVAEIQKIVRLYRDTYRGYNARHFYQTVKREHGVKLSYSYVRQLLQAAGLMKKGRARGRHRMRRPRRQCFGEMLHLDGSLHCWLALMGEESDPGRGNARAFGGGTHSFLLAPGSRSVGKDEPDSSRSAGQRAQGGPGHHPRRGQ